MTLNYKYNLIDEKKTGKRYDGVTNGDGNMISQFDMNLIAKCRWSILV